MENLELYEQFREVPAAAKRPITGGRLKGKTEINPMWRIKALTEQFGPCGIGWKPVITRQWFEPGADGEVIAMVNLDLYYRTEGHWSDPVPGTGGNMLVSKEKGKLVSNDDALKMAFTDALSVAAKLLGVGADVYFEQDCSKYGRDGLGDPDPEVPCCKNCGRVLTSLRIKGEEYSLEESIDKLDGLCVACWRERKAAKGEKNSV